MSISTTVTDAVTTHLLDCQDRLSKPAARMRRSFAAHEKTDAEALLIHHGGRKDRPDFAQLTFRGVAAGYILQKRHEGLQEVSLKSYEKAISWAFPFIGDMAISAIGADDLRQAFRSGLQQGETLIQLKNNLRHVNRVLSYAILRKAIRTNPMVEARKTIKFPRQSSAGRFEPPDDHMSLLTDAATIVETVALELATTAGLKPMEIDDLLIADCDFRGRKIFVRHAVLKGDDPNRPAGRWVKMPDTLFAAIMLARSWERMVYGRNGEKVLFESSAQNLLDALQRRVGLFSTNKLVTNPDGSQSPRTCYSVANFNHVAAKRYIAQGIRARQLTIVMDLTLVTILKHYRQWLEAYEGPSVIDASRKASDLVLSKIKQLGLSIPTYCDQTPTTLETNG